MNKAFGFGKTIILGEHFVVCNKPALVGAIDLKTQASVQHNKTDKLVFIDKRPKSPGFVANKVAAYNQMLENILIFLGIKQRNFDITVFGDLPVTCGGIGASAACAVSVIKAFNQFLNLHLNDAQVNEIAIFAESAVHGNPSGIDNAAALFGGLFKYSKQSGAAQICIQKPIKIILVDSGKQTNTKLLISLFKTRLEEAADKTKIILNRYDDIFNTGMRALNNFNLTELGLCMNENHYLLQNLGISCSELDLIVQEALKIGALGAKLTGTGGGGLVLILPPEDFEIHKKLLSYFKANNFFTIEAELRSF